MNRVKVCITLENFSSDSKGGGQSRSIYNMITAMKNIDFYILTWQFNGGKKDSGELYLPTGWIKFLENVFIFDFSFTKLNYSKLKELLLDLNPDVLYVNGIYSWKFSLLPVLVSRTINLKTIVAPRGMLSAHSISIKKYKKRFYLFFIKYFEIYKSIEFHTTSLDESISVRSIIGDGVKISCIANFASTGNLNLEKISKTPGKLKLLYFNRISPEKGLLKALESMMRLDGDLTFTIIGNCYDREYWSMCTTIIKELPSNIHVDYCGEQSFSKVLDFLIKSHASILLTDGENYGHSIVESLSCGRPILVTKNTPWKDLKESSAGWDILEEQAASHIQYLIDMDQAEYDSFLYGSKKYFDVRVSRTDFLRLEYTKLFEI
jgi:glycosyltransferase involved in cell wall biosynthesis